MADHDRLDEPADELIAEDEQTQDSKSRVPVRKDGEREKRRRARAEHSADVRNEAQQSREHAPQGGMRDLQHPQPESDEQAKAEIEQGDGEQIAADALRGLADGLRGDG